MFHMGIRLIMNNVRLVFILIQLAYIKYLVCRNLLDQQNF